MYLSIARLFEEADVEPESANANSSDSGLLKLSAELRLLIYKYVFQGEVIHLSKSKTGHKSVICPKIKCRTCDRRTQCPLYRSREENVDPTGGDAGNNNPTQDGAQGTVFSILQTCQQIYNEASHVMDSTVTFDVAYMAVWILFCQTFPRGRLARIRRFQIHYWTGYIPGTDKHPANAQYCEFWGLVAFCMPALRHLHFCMDFTSLNRLGALYMDFDKRWPNWAIPILYVRGLLSCELTVNVNFNAALDMISVDEYRDLVPLRRDCLEEMKRIMCRQVDRQKVDLSDLFLGHAFPQGDRDGLRALLKKRYVTMIPRNLERRVRISVVSIGILRSELYQPDSIPAHRDNPDLTRKRADGNLYVNDIIEWLVQKVSNHNVQTSTLPADFTPCPGGRTSNYAQNHDGTCGQKTETSLQSWP